MPLRNSLALALVPAAALAALALAAPPQFGVQQSPASPAAEGPPGITVVATGEVHVQPDEVTVALRVRARDTLPLESFDAFKQRRALFVQAMEAFDDVPLTLEPQGVRIGVHLDPNQVFINGQQQTAAPPYETTEIVRARLNIADDAAEGVELVSEIVQAAVDVECALDVDDTVRYAYFGQAPKGPPVQYRLSREALVTARDEAMRRAMDDARQQATTLANLAGRRLGPIENVTVVEPFPETRDASGPVDRGVKLSVRFLFAD